MKTAADLPEEQHFIVSRLSPDRPQRRLALGIVLALLLAFSITAGPLSNIQLGRIEAFIPAYVTAMFVIDLITAVLLLAQFSILRSPALLVIASGYLFTALIVIPWMLTFPGVFAPSGLLGAGLQSTAYLYIVWHAGFPISVIAYALLKQADPAKRWREGSVATAIFSSVAVTASAVCVATFLVTAGDPLLPRLMIDTVRLSDLWAYAAGFPALLSVLALVVLWVRWCSVLDLWLMVVMCAYAIEICIISFFSTRFSVGWYVGRACGFLSGSLVLFVLLYEITKLYAKLLRALFAQRREREARLMTGDAVSASIAHEVKQPLGAIISNANAGLNFLNRVEPDLGEVREALQQVVSDGHRADAVIENIRALFKKGVRTRTSLDINNVIQEALAVVRDNLQRHRVAVRADRNERVPRVRGEQVQLQQVLVNLITNAIDSMATKDGERVLSLRSEVHHSGCVMVSVEDTGKGLEPSAVDRIFNPMFTTKSDGMGMGLSICRSIIEAHGGQLWVTADPARGAIFHFTVLADPGSALIGPAPSAPRSAASA
jgi:signal transduction histidine kinase